MKRFMLSLLFCSLGLLADSLQERDAAPWRAAHKHSLAGGDSDRFDFIRNAVSQLATKEEFNAGVHRWALDELNELLADVKRTKKTSAPRFVNEGLLPESRMRQLVQSSAHLSNNLLGIADRFDKKSKDPKAIAFFELQTKLSELNNLAIAKAHLLEAKK